MATLFMDTAYLNTGDSGGTKKKAKTKSKRKKNGTN
jgi:hypothetical protein